MKYHSVIIKCYSITWCFQLFEKCERVSSNIKGFRGEHTFCLVIVVIFSRNIHRQPRENDLRARQPYEADHLFQTGSVPPGLKGMQYILTWSIGSIEEPNIKYSHVS